MFEAEDKEQATAIWLNKEFEKPISLHDFITQHTSQSFKRVPKQKTMSIVDEKELINFSTQFIKAKGSDDFG